MSSKISIITVTYNAQATLEATISSVTLQSYNAIEYIVIDGGSTDGTIDIIKKHNDKITFWMSEPDRGVYDAMNKGVAKATGDWIYFLGAGDILFNVLDKVVPLLADSHCLYYGNVYRKDLLKVYDGKFSPFRFAVANICHQSIFYPASLFKKYSYNLKYKIQADYALNMQCYGDPAFRFSYIPVIVCLYEGDGYSDKTMDLPFFADKINLIKINFSKIVYAYAAVRRAAARALTSKYKKINSNHETGA